MTNKINLANDYTQAMHPNILERLVQTNTEKTSGYGTDPYTAAAQEGIRQACQAPQAEVRFLTGGTQTNQIMIASFLQSYQGSWQQAQAISAFMKPVPSNLVATRSWRSLVQTVNSVPLLSETF